MMNCVDLPTVLVAKILEFVDHDTLYQAEMTSSFFLHTIRELNLWQEKALQAIIVMEHDTNKAKKKTNRHWKHLSCFARKNFIGERNILSGVRECSSIDSLMESPLNTISLSKCWKNIEYFQENPLLGNLCEMREYQSFAMTLGERIQLQCGCSAGTPCYWSSEPSNCQKKTDFIEYFIQKPCVLRCFHVLPYRCFWHPNSPVYGPQKVSFEFYPFQKEGNLLSKVPFYVSPKFEVKNEMKMQEFELPRRVLIEEDIVVKVQFHGKHQAQTLQLPAWMQRTPDDLLPKYYVCISFVGALGLSYSFERSQKASFW